MMKIFNRNESSEVKEGWMIKNNTSAWTVMSENSVLFHWEGRQKHYDKLLGSLSTQGWDKTVTSVSSDPQRTTVIHTKSHGNRVAWDNIELLEVLDRQPERTTLPFIKNNKKNKIQQKLKQLNKDD